MDDDVLSMLFRCHFDVRSHVVSLLSRVLGAVSPLRSDECSVFGIATKPPYSRCYNSSQSLWMRRAYNGVLYNRGRQLPPAQSMPKIHPGDVVRCEVDMDDGTVRFR